MGEPLPIKMLVADDTQLVRRLFREFAVRWPTPIDLVEANDGVTCLATLGSSHIDVAFLDVHMPSMSGIEALCHARQAGDRTFTIIMSETKQAEVVQIAKSLGAYDFLEKPFTPADLIDRMRSYERIAQVLRVLIVDDSNVMRRMMAKIAEQSIFRLSVDEAEDGEAAVKMCEASGTYDLIFLDVNMPGLDSVRTLAQIRRKSPQSKVIVISSDGEHKVRRRFADEKMDFFLAKPFLPHHLDSTLRTIFGLSTPFRG